MFKMGFMSLPGLSFPALPARFDEATARRAGRRRASPSVIPADTKPGSRVKVPRDDNDGASWDDKNRNGIVRRKRKVILILFCLFYFSAPAFAVDSSDVKIALLKNRSRPAEIRLEEMRQLASSYPDRMFDMLMRLLKDKAEPPVIRTGARDLLAQLGGEKVYAAFVKFYEDPLEDPMVRRHAFTKLIQMGWAQDYEKLLLIALNRKEDVIIRRYALGFLLRSDGVDRELILKSLVENSNEDEALRVEAMHYMREFLDLKAAVTYIVGYLQRKNESIFFRAQAGVNLYNMQAAEALPVFSVILQDETEPSGMKSFAIEFITLMGGEMQLGVLREFAANSPDLNLVESAQNAIYSIQGQTPPPEQTAAG